MSNTTTTPTLYQNLDAVPKPVTLLLKGDSGAGKTWKAAHFPRPVFFNFDNNLSGLRKLPDAVRANVRVVDPRRNEKGPVEPAAIWTNFIGQLEAVAADKSIGTIVIDSLTTMGEILFDKVLKTDDPAKAPEIQHWGEFARYLKWLGENLLCATDLDKHVVFLAHEQMVTEKQTGKVKYFLAIGGQTKANFDLYFTDCWRAYTRAAKDGGVEYWIRTLPTEYHTAKSSLVLPADFKWDDKKDDIAKQLAAGLPTS